jgi:bifunctional DNA-binding transcriptional regulator/antitoxin component of YhaV-PrlF toxin-antitoxin module
MSKVKIEGNRLTLPEHLRKILTAAASDSIEAEEVEGGVLLKRPPAARRALAMRKIRGAQRRVNYTGPKPRPSPQEEEQQIAEMLAAEKLDRRASGR